MTDHTLATVLADTPEQADVAQLAAWFAAERDHARALLDELRAAQPKITIERHVDRPYPYIELEHSDRYRYEGFLVPGDRETGELAELRAVQVWPNPLFRDDSP